jgi:hypothetical protein
MFSDQNFVKKILIFPSVFHFRPSYPPSSNNINIIKKGRYAIFSGSLSFICQNIFKIQLEQDIHEVQKQTVCSP